jgi:hypothetical protein
MLRTLATFTTFAAVAATSSLSTDFVSNYTTISGSSCAASCGSSSDKASNVVVNVSPCTYDPSSPEPVTFTLSYQLNEVVTGGTSTIDLKWNGVTVTDKTVDLCIGGVLANDTAVPCPTPAAPYKGGSSDTITPPKGAPAGSYVGRQTWNDQNGDQILCLAYILSVKGEE